MLTQQAPPRTSSQLLLFHRRIIAYRARRDCRARGLSGAPGVQPPGCPMQRGPRCRVRTWLRRPRDERNRCTGSSIGSGWKPHPWTATAVRPGKTPAATTAARRSPGIRALLARHREARASVRIPFAVEWGRASGQPAIWRGPAGHSVPVPTRGERRSGDSASGWKPGSRVNPLRPRASASVVPRAPPEKLPGGIARTSVPCGITNPVRGDDVPGGRREKFLVTRRGTQGA